MQNIVRIFAVITFALGLVAGCFQPESLSHQLFGEWQWLESNGGFFGKHLTPESEGYNITIRFTADSQYVVYRNDTLKTVDTFTLRLQDPGKGLQSGDTLRFADDTIIRILDWEGEDILVLKDLCFDCFVSRYMRKQLVD